MPKRKSRLPSLPLDASSQDEQAWREKGFQHVSEEVEERYGDFIVSEALMALNTGRGEEAYNAPWTR